MPIGPIRNGSSGPPPAAGRVAGRRVHDARIGALCIAHGVRELWTADRDFSRFPSLTASNPFAG